MYEALFWLNGNRVQLGPITSDYYYTGSRRVLLINVWKSEHFGHCISTVKEIFFSLSFHIKSVQLVWLSGCV